MQHVAGDDGSVARVAAEFVRLASEGRGDGARGRNLYALRFLDATARPDGALHFDYRPSRNPGAFLAMVFDLVGDALHGYLARIEGGAEPAEDAVDGVRTHVAERLAAPWGAFVAELRRAGFPHLADLVDETVADALRRPAVSDLPTVLRAIESWTTPEQFARFDADRYVRELALHQVLRLLRYDGADHDRTVRRREQHATGGDLRTLIRRRVDRPWRKAFDRADAGDPIAFLASWPVDVGWLADLPEEHDFAVAYAVATDAKAPGRTWSAPAPFVRDGERAEFDVIAGRAAAAGAVRREARLRRWGVSATFPSSTAALDDRLVESADDVPALHAGAAWRAFVRRHGDALEVARRRFVQQVADVLEGRAAS